MRQLPLFCVEKIMASKYHLLDEVNPDADGWKLQVRVVRLWESHAFEKPSDASGIEMILMDEQSSRIHATVKKSLILKFRELLTEGNVYAISNFSLSDNNGKFKMTTHPYRVHFLATTRVKEVVKGFPTEHIIYSFTEFQSIIDKKIGEDRAIDIVGVLGGYTDVIDTSNDGRSTRRVGFQLLNERKQRMRCTLWAEHADYFMDFLPKCDEDIHIIVVLQLVRYRPWLRKAGVSNCYFGTKVIFGSNDPSVLGFQARVLATQQIPITPEKYQSIDRLNVAYTLAEFAPGCKRVLVNNLRDISEVKKVIIVGKVLCIQKDQLWYYIGCSKCYKAVPDDDLGQYNIEDCEQWKCGKCNESGHGFDYRYKLQVRVKDTSGSVSLTLFHRDVLKLIGKSASELFKSLPSDVDDDVFPDNLNVMVGNLYVFLLSIAQYNITNSYHVFTVSDVSNQQELLANFPMEVELLRDSSSRETSIGSDEDCTVVTPPAGAITSTSGTTGKRRNVGCKEDEAEGSNTVKRKLVFVKEEKP